ncbi:hypothetical protein DPMN_003881 [Dreissena polymorpha]|uniref:Uncharacterized protein n=1 Tax=Dreissena polymorpha TaxID=45954 RepID=A0A9D4MPQ9_DREPO|nr:hypothetical protein DPMN_003881 [Dreissena polymorpha]
MSRLSDISLVPIYSPQQFTWELGTSSHVYIETSDISTIHVIPELNTDRSVKTGLYDATLIPGFVTFLAWGAGLEVEVFA